MASLLIVSSFALLAALSHSQRHQRGDARDAAGPAPVVNALVAPDAIYVARKGSRTGLSVIDLNGFGASTGNPAYDITQPILQGNSNFPNNPNVNIQGTLFAPPLAPGTTTIDGGSAGVFTLTLNADLEDVLFGAPRALDVGDMMLGHPLNLVFDPSPINLCADPRLQVIQAAFSAPHTLVPALNIPPIHEVTGAGNTISWAPHPNPPPLDPTTLLAAQPTSIVTTLPPPLGPGLLNLLAPGPNFLGNPGIGFPPTNMLASEQNSFFVGPGLPQPTILACPTYMVGQPIGHFLYVLDRASGAVVVLDSNRMTELARIQLMDPSELAMAPDLDLLAVSDRATSSVAFIDIDPRSPTFHQVVRATSIGQAPSGIAWEPGNEDILVCNEGDGTVSVLSADTLQVRKTLRGFDRPFAVAITPRQDRFGLRRNVYFAYILERSGRLSLFESGPNGPNGWGYDDVILRSTFRFLAPQAIQPDHSRLESGVWIAHAGRLDPQGHPTDLRGGALTNVFLEGTPGQQPLRPDEPPHARFLQLSLARSIGSDQLTGLPTDLAFDDQRNLGALTNYHTVFSHGTPVPANGKSLVRDVLGVGVLSTNEPTYAFVPTRSFRDEQELIDVIDLRTGLRVDTNSFVAGVQSIPISGANKTMDYFRQ